MRISLKNNLFLLLLLLLCLNPVIANTNYNATPLTITSDQEFCGTHHNITDFVVNSGVTITACAFNGSTNTGYAIINATTINISGILNADGIGHGGGSGSGGGGGGDGGPNDPGSGGSLGGPTNQLGENGSAGQNGDLLGGEPGQPGMGYPNQSGHAPSNYDISIVINASLGDGGGGGSGSAGGDQVAALPGGGGGGGGMGQDGGGYFILVAKESFTSNGTFLARAGQNDCGDGIDGSPGESGLGGDAGAGAANNESNCARSFGGLGADGQASGSSDDDAADASDGFFGAGGMVVIASYNVNLSNSVINVSGGNSSNGGSIKILYAGEVLSNGTYSSYSSLVYSSISNSWFSAPNQNPSLSFPVLSQNIFGNVSANWSVTYTDVDGDVGNITFFHFVDGVSVFNQTFVNQVNNSVLYSVLSSGNFSSSQNVSVVVSVVSLSSYGDNVTNSSLVSNTAPVLSDLSRVSPDGRVSDDDDITWNVTVTDSVDSDYSNITFSLFVDGLSVLNSTSSNVSSGSTVSIVLSSGNFSSSQNVSINVSATDGSISNVLFDSVVINSAPVFDTLSLLPADLSSDEDSYVALYWTDADSDLLNYSCNFSVDDLLVDEQLLVNNVAGVLTQSNDVSNSLYDVGQNLSVVCFASDGVYITSSVSDSLIVNNPTGSGGSGSGGGGGGGSGSFSGPTIILNDSFVVTPEVIDSLDFNFGGSGPSNIISKNLVANRNLSSCSLLDVSHPGFISCSVSGTVAFVEVNSLGNSSSFSDSFEAVVELVSSSGEGVTVPFRVSVYRFGIFDADGELIITKIIIYSIVGSFALLLFTSGFSTSKTFSLKKE